VAPGMAGSHTVPSAGRFEVRVTADSHFAWVRTRLALERTIMSWLRTAVALIGFGFAIVQYINHLQQISGARPAFLPTAPEYLGLALILCGIVALVISIWQYRWSIRYLWGEPFEPLAGVTNEGMQSPVMAVAVLLIFFGVFAFFAVLLRLT
jgi:putative membrane protein